MPRYLRVEGPVRNRHIQRKEVNELINGFWQHRLTTQDKMEPVRGGNILTLSLSHSLTFSLSLSPSPRGPYPITISSPHSLILHSLIPHPLTFSPSSLSHPSPFTLSPSHPLTSMYP